MDIDSLHFLGRLGKPWGHQGELTVHLEEVDIDEITHAGSIFVDIDGQRVPFFFSKLYEKNQNTLIKFDDFHDPQSASILVGRDIYAPPGHLLDGSDESWDPEDFVGMLVRDEKHGDLGEVTALEGNAKNPVLVIMLGTQEVMVPLVDEMIVDINMEERSLLIRTPEGLIDLYRTP